jgi:zinc protease
MLLHFYYFLRELTMLPIHTNTLKNGLKVIVMPNTKAPLVAINLAYKVGSKNEEPHMTGIAHLFEHLMFEGSKHIAKGDFDKYCSMAGGTNNAYTTFDLTSYNMTLPKHQLELGLWLESDRMMEFSVTEDSLITQQKVVSEEILQTVQNQPYGMWRELLSGTAFSKECSYSWEVHGSSNHVMACNLDYLRKFFSKYYQPDNACLVLCGDIEPENALSLVDRYFSEIPVLNGMDMNRTFERNCILGRQRAEFYDNIPAAGVFLGYHCPGFTDDDIFKADIISNLFGNGRKSRLYDYLIDDLEIASHTGSYVDSREDASLLIFYALASSREISADALKIKMQDTIDKFITEGVFKDEIEKSINQLTTRIAYEFQYNSSLADLVAQQSLFWDEPSRVFKLLDMYKIITVEEIVEFAKRIFAKDNTIEIVALPKI